MRENLAILWSMLDRIGLEEARSRAARLTAPDLRRATDKAIGRMQAVQKLQGMSPAQIRRVTGHPGLDQ